MPADLDDMFGSLRGEPVFTPPAADVRTAADRRARHRTAYALSSTAVAVVTVIGVAIGFARPPGVPPTPATSPSYILPSPTQSPSPRLSQLPQPTIVECTNDDVSLKSIGGYGFAGGGVEGYALTNTGQRTCQLLGWIDYQAIDGQHHELQLNVRQSGGSGEVTLAPGQVGYFTLTTFHGGRGYDGTTCSAPWDTEDLRLPGEADPISHWQIVGGCATTNLEISGFTKTKPVGLHS